MYDTIYYSPTADRLVQKQLVGLPKSGRAAALQIKQKTSIPVQADFELQGSHRNVSSEFSQSLKAVSFVSCLVVFVRGSLNFVLGPWAWYRLYCQGSAAVLIWLPGRGIRWGLNPACTGTRAMPEGHNVGDARNRTWRQAT